MSSASKPSDSDDLALSWEVAHLFPKQGQWSENDYFALHANRMVELVNSNLELLPMPTWLHQLIVKFLTKKVEAASKGMGTVLAAPLPVRLFPGTIREPDVMYFAPGSEPSEARDYPTRLDLAMEVVSEGPEANRRDYEDKRRDYERAGVAEYWIVDPEQKQITVLVLDENIYRVHGVFQKDQIASGILLPNLRIPVNDTLEVKA